MASSLSVLLTINLAGSPIPFAQPFTVPLLETEQEPAVYQITVAADDEGVVWDGEPLGTTADFIALVANRSAQFRFTCAGGDFTIEATTPGIPVVISGGQIDVGSGLQNITQIDAINVDTVEIMTVSACIAQAAS